MQKYLKRRVSSGLLVGLIASATLLSANDSASLVGIEGGYSGVTSEITERVETPNRYTQDMSRMENVGVKIGAEGENYRVFLGARYYLTDSKYDSLATYGVDFQYKFNVSSVFNIFVGVGTGLATAKFNLPGEPFSRTIFDPYYSGDVGVNFHLAQSVDFELGARYLSLEALNSKSDVDYNFSNIMTGYASVIIKWQMD